MAVTNLRARPIPLPPPIGGVIEDVDDPKLIQPGTLSEGENFVPQRAPRLATRGGSRILLTLHDDAGAPAELSHVLGCGVKAATGAVLIGWSAGTTKHYAYAVTSDMAFAGASEALSRTAFPASWNRATPARPVIASLFERLYVADASVIYGARNPVAVIDAVTPPGITVPTFAFVAGGAGAQGLFAYCLEEYNNVLFIAGYGDEEVGTGDDPALVRHSFLGVAPDAANGFDKDAYNTIGSKGDRVTAMRKGRGLLLIAKGNELYRVSGFGRAYPGWQYQIEGVFNTQGYGVENPLALEHAEGYWFGIGKEGPFRTDGFTVESLVGPRQRTWRGIDKLDLAWVRYHPERRLVLFGVHVVSSAPDATWPWVILTWDTARNVWQPNWKFAGGATRFFVAATVPTSTSAGPGAPPTAPVTTAIGETGWTAGWTTGDALAETEYWERDVGEGGAWALVQVLAAGVATYNRGGRTNHHHYAWRVRHRRSGVFSNYAADQDVFTLITDPSIGYPAEAFGAVEVDMVNNSDAMEMLVERASSADGFTAWTVISTDTQAPGAFSVIDRPGGGDFRYRVRGVDSSWTPSETAIIEGDTVTVFP